MARRTPQELASHHEAEAKRHALKAKYASDPLLREVDGMRRALVKMNNSARCLSDEGGELSELISTAIYSLDNVHDELAKDHA